MHEIRRQITNFSSSIESMEQNGNKHETWSYSNYLFVATGLCYVRIMFQYQFHNKIWYHSYLSYRWWLLLVLEPAMIMIKWKKNPYLLLFLFLYHTYSHTQSMLLKCSSRKSCSSKKKKHLWSHKEVKRDVLNEWNKQ